MWASAALSLRCLTSARACGKLSRVLGTAAVKADLPLLPQRSYSAATASRSYAVLVGPGRRTPGTPWRISTAQPRLSAAAQLLIQKAALRVTGREFKPRA